MHKSIQVAKNKHINRNYRIIDEIVAGIVLFGAEIKAIRTYKLNINSAYISISQKNEFILHNAPINATFSNVAFANYDAKRSRKLLLTKIQIERWSRKANKQNLTIIPRVVFLSAKNILKLKICLCEGLKKHDKRLQIKTKDLVRERKYRYGSSINK